jgi:hypothetical protein
VTDDIADDLYRKNLDYLATSMPHIHRAVARLETLNSALVAVGEDDWDVEFRGVRLFGEGARKAAETYCRDTSHWNRMGVARPALANVDYFAGTLLTPMLERAEKAEISFGPDLTDVAGYYLIVYGIGLGVQLPELVDFTKCRVLILVEPSPELLVHSMRVFDWADFLQDMAERKILVYFVTADRDVLMTNQVRQYVRFFNPGRVDGSYLFTTYYNSVLDSSRRMLLDEMTVTLSGLGWLDDEILMVRNSHANLKDGQALIYRGSSVVRDWPVFIVGSGPSIDHDIDMIAANADRAIVIACGTGLGPLLRRGIRPDLYVELENFEQSYTFLASVVKEYSLEGITLVGTTTIDPRIPPLFDRTVFFLRAGLASYPVFCRDAKSDLPNVNPTVTNTGLAYALGAGFREFYFFGVDLGAKDPKRHHSKETPYYKGVLPDAYKPTIQFPGNFGGVVHADGVFQWAHDSFEKVIAGKRVGHRFYNCSDGAQIKGAVPKLASSLKLPVRTQSKREVIDSLLAEYQPYGLDTFRAVWQPQEHLAAVTEFRDQLQEICDRFDPDSAWDYINELVRFLIPINTVPSHHYFRGSILLAVLAASYFLNRSPDGQRKLMDEIVHDEMKKLIDRLHDRVHERLSDLEAAPPVED